VHPLRQWLATKLLGGPPPESKALVVSYPAQLFWGIADAQQPDNALSNITAFKAFALAYACMQFRATKLAEAPIWIAEESDDGEAMLEGEHPLSELLEQPNPDMEMYDLLEQISLYLDTGGSCLLVKNRGRDGVTRSLYPYAQHEFSVEPANGLLYGLFRLQTLTGWKSLGPEDVLYIRRPSPEHLLSVMAPIDAALSHINIGHALRTAVKAAMRHAVRPGAMFMAPNALGEDQFDRLKSEIGETYAGVWNAGKSMLLEGGVTAEVLKANLDDLALGAVNGDVEVAVCQAFQMHPVLVGSRMGIEGSSGFADSMGPALELFYDLAVFPRWGRIEKAFTRGLLREVDDNPRRFIRFDTSKVRALQEDMGEKITQAAAATFWTEAEQRAWTGKEGGSEELPSDKAERVQEQMAEAGGGEDEEAPNGRPVLVKSRIVDLLKTDFGWRATVSNGNGDH